MHIRKRQHFRSLTAYSRYIHAVTIIIIIIYRFCFYLLLLFLLVEYFHYIHAYIFGICQSNNELAATGTTRAITITKQPSAVKSMAPQALDQNIHWVTVIVFFPSLHPTARVQHKPCSLPKREPIKGKLSFGWRKNREEATEFLFYLRLFVFPKLLRSVILLWLLLWCSVYVPRNSCEKTFAVKWIATIFSIESHMKKGEW